MCFKTRGSDTFEFFDENKRNVSIIARVFLSIIYLKADFYCFSALLVSSCRVQLFVMLLSDLGSSLGSLRAILAIFILCSAICAVSPGKFIYELLVSLRKPGQG